MTDKRGRKQPGGGTNGRATGAGRSGGPGRSGSAGRGTGAERGTDASRGTGVARSPVPGKAGGGRPAMGSRSSSAARPAPAGRRSSGTQSAPRVARPTRKVDRSPQAVLTLYRPDLSQILAAADVPGFRYAQVLEHLLRRADVSFAEASSLPADLRTALDGAGASVLTVVATRKAPDGTTKLLLAARDGAQVEAVLLPYGNRLTVCISSQVGCGVGCAFCATGALGFRRNLSTAEIVDQVRAAAAASSTGQRLSNVVYMGMGEPLLNLGAVLDSVRVLTAPSGLGLGHRSLSISTVGIPNGILRLARTEPQVNLALSLHAPDDATRAVLIPDKYRHPLTEVLEAAWQHFEITRRKLLVEYVLVAGVNDSIDDARRLAALLRGHVVTVNLLAWNPVYPQDHLEPAGQADTAKRTRTQRTFVPSSPAAVAAFRTALRAAHIEAVVRQSKGAGIEAACGQLAGSAGSYEDSASKD